MAHGKNNSLLKYLLIILSYGIISSCNKATAIPKPIDQYEYATQMRLKRLIYEMDQLISYDLEYYNKEQNFCDNFYGPNNQRFWGIVNSNIKENNVNVIQKFIALLDEISNLSNFHCYEFLKTLQKIDNIEIFEASLVLFKFNKPFNGGDYFISPINRKYLDDYFIPKVKLIEGKSTNDYFNCKKIECYERHHNLRDKSNTFLITILKLWYNGEIEIKTNNEN